MKKSLTAFAILILISIAAIYGATLFLHGWNFAVAHGEFVRTWLWLRHYVSTFFLPGAWSNIANYVIVAAVALILIVDLVVLGKTIQLRKPFVNYLTFFVIILVAALGLLAFIPYLPTDVPPAIADHLPTPPGTSSIPVAVMALLADPATQLPGWILVGALGAFAIFSITFLILAFVNLASSPFPMKKAKKTQKAQKTDHEIVQEEFGRISEVEAPKTAVPLAHEIRRSAKEELAPKKAVTPPPPAPAVQPEKEARPGEPLVRPLTLEEIRAIIRDELERSNLSNKGNDPFRLAPVIYAAPWMNPMPYPPYPNYGYPPAPQQPYNPGVTGASREDLRAIISQELEKVSPSKKEIQSLVEQEVTRLSPTSKEAVYSIVNEELIKYDALNREALDSLVSEKVDKYDTVNKGLIRSTLTEEIKKYDEGTRTAIRKAFTEELGTYDKGLKGQLSEIIDDRIEEKVIPALGVSQKEVEDLVSKKIQHIQFPAPEDLRVVFNEEISRAVAGLKKEQPEAKVDDEHIRKIVTKELETNKIVVQISAEEVRKIVLEEVKNLPVHSDLDEQAVRAIVDEKLNSLNIPSTHEIRAVIAEELRAYFQKVREEKPAVVEKPVLATVKPEEKKETVTPLFKKAPVKEKPQVVAPLPPVIEEEEAAEEPEETEETEEEGNSSAGAVRISFQQRMKTASKDLLANYNTIKNYLISFGVKSRVSNTGDTFRLHLKSYVKITVAGKGLKLYMALRPDDYANSTIPVNDASHISLYVDTPLVFKVKSDLSVKRALSLIDDLMKENGLVQESIPAVNWAKDFR